MLGKILAFYSVCFLIIKTVKSISNCYFWKNFLMTLIGQTQSIDRTFVGEKKQMAHAGTRTWSHSNTDELCTNCVTKFDFWHGTTTPQPCFEQYSWTFCLLFVSESRWTGNDVERVRHGVNGLEPGIKRTLFMWDMLYQLYVFIVLTIHTSFL